LKIEIEEEENEDDEEKKLGMTQRCQTARSSAIVTA
jgi:hypothetical protein